MTIWDDPNRQVLGLEPAWVEGTGGSEDAEPKVSAAEAGEKTVDLRSHAGLDQLAADQGHVWSSDDLTVSEKREELGV